MTDPQEVLDAEETAERLRRLVDVVNAEFEAAQEVRRLEQELKRAKQHQQMCESKLRELSFIERRRRRSSQAEGG